jgi:hypothetical protein
VGLGSVGVGESVDAIVLVPGKRGLRLPIPGPVGQEGCRLSPQQRSGRRTRGQVPEVKMLQNPAYDLGGVDEGDNFEPTSALTGPGVKGSTS